MAASNVKGRRKSKIVSVSVSGELKVSPELISFGFQQLPVELGEQSKRKNRLGISATVLSPEKQESWIVTTFELKQLSDEEVISEISADYTFLVAHNEETTELESMQKFAGYLIATSVWPLFSTLVGAVAGQTDPSIAPPPKRLQFSEVNWRKELDNADSGS